MRVFIIVLMICCLTNLLRASVPQQISYQGQLTNPSGSPLDTSVAMTFRLYTDSTAGSLLWMETRPSVNVIHGLFNVRLGQVTPLTDPVLNQNHLWLGISAGSDGEMRPRTRLVSVAYSYRVGTLDSALGGTIIGDVNVHGKGMRGPESS